MKPTQRRSWLNAISVFVAILMILNLLSLPLLVLQLFNGGYVIGTVDLAGLVPPGLPGHTPDNASFGNVELYWHTTGALQMLLFGLSHGLGAAVATLPMLEYASRTVREAREHDPFTLSMVRRLRVLGLLVLVGGLVSELAAFLAGWALLHLAVARIGVNVVQAASTNVPTFWWLLPGLLLLAFAEVIRHGCALRTELDAVI